MDVYDSYSKNLLSEDILPFEMEDAAVDAKEETTMLPSTGVKQIRRIFGGDTGPTNTNSSSNTGSGPNNNNNNNNNNTIIENGSISNNNSSRSASNRSNRSRPETSKKQVKEEEQEEAEPELVQNVSEFDAVINHTRRQHLPGQKEWLELRGERRLITDEEALHLVLQFEKLRTHCGANVTPRILVRVDKYGNCRFAKADDIRKNVNTKRSIPLVAPPPASSSATSSSSSGAAAALSSAVPPQPLQDKKKQSSPVVVAAATPVAASAAPVLVSVPSTTIPPPPKKADKQLPKRMNTINNYNNNSVMIKQPRSSMDTNSTCSDTNTSMLIDDSDHSVSSKKRKVAPPPLTITTTTTAASSIASSYCGSSSNSSGGKHHSKQLPPSKPTLTLRGILTEYYEMLNALENEYGVPSVASTGLTQPHHAHDFRKTLDAFLSVPYTDQLPESMLGLALQGYHHIKQTTMALWDELYRIYTSTGMGGGRKYSLSSSNNNTPPRGPFGGGGGNASGNAGGHDAADSSGLGGKGSSGYGPFSSSSMGNRGNSNNNSNSTYRGRSRASGVEDPSDTDTLASNTETRQGLCEKDKKEVDTAPVAQSKKKAAKSTLASTPKSGSDRSLGKSEGSSGPAPKTDKVGKHVSTVMLTGNVKSSSSGRRCDASDHSKCGERGLDRSDSSSNSTCSFGTVGSNQKGLGGSPGRRHSDTLSLKKETRRAPGDNGKDDGHDEDNFGAGGVALRVKAERKVAHPVVPSPKSPRSVSSVQASLALEHKPGKCSSIEAIRSSITLDPPQVDSAKSAFSRWSTNALDAGSIRNTSKVQESESSLCQEPFKIVCSNPGDKKTMNASSSVRRSWDVGQGGDRSPNAIFSSRSRSSIGGQAKPQDLVGIEKQPEKNENMHKGVVLKRSLSPIADDSKVRIPHATASAKTSPMEEPKKTVRPWKSWEQGLKKDGAMMPPLTNDTDDTKDESEASVLPVFRALAHKLAQTESIETEEIILPRQELQDLCSKHDPEHCCLDQETTLKDETCTVTPANQTTARTALKEKLCVHKGNNNNQKEIDPLIETKTLRHEPKPTNSTRRLQQLLPPPYRAPFTASERDKTREKKGPEVKTSTQVESSKHEWMQPCGWTAMAKPLDLNSTGVDASKSLIRLW